MEAGAGNAKKHAGMTLVDAKNESFDDANKTYEKAKEILRKHPDIKGFQTSAGNDVLGVGRAIEEAGLSGKVCLVGTGLPSGVPRPVVNSTMVAPAAASAVEDTASLPGASSSVTPPAPACSPPASR